MTQKFFVLFCVALIFSTSSCNMNTQTTVKNSNNKDISMLKIGDTIDTASFIKTNSNILYSVVQQGTGSTPIRGEKTTVHYTGWLLQKDNTLGAKFDSSRDRGNYFEFNVGVGYVIPGWDEMVAEMKVGERRIIVLPSNMAYGSRGAGGLIPPHATLVFDVELFKIS